MPRQFIPLIPEVPISSGRTTAQYAEFLNGYFDAYQGSISNTRKVFFSKRPWVVPAATNPGSTFSNLTGFAASNNTAITGVVTSLDNTKLIFSTYDFTGLAADAKYYDASTNTLTDRATPLGWGTVSHFTRLDGISYGGTYYYAATDFTKGALIDATGTWTEIVAAVFGAATKTNLVAMDGYIFYGIVSGTNAGRLYNTDLGVPSSITATSYVTPADWPGQLVWLSRIRNYLVVFKQYSIEFFENVGNPTPGSPLDAQRQLNRRIGLVSPSSVQEVSDGVIFLGINEKGKIQLFKIMRDSLQIQEISTPQIEYAVMNQTASFPYFGSYRPYIVGDNKICSQVINWKNKELYLVTLPIPSEGVFGNQTFVYDNELNLWCTWIGANSINYFRAEQATLISGTNSTGYRGPLLVYNGAVGTAAGSFQVLVPDLTYAAVGTTGEVGESGNFSFSIKTDLLDFGDLTKRKFLDQLILHYDGRLTSAYNSPITLTYYDTDYNSASSGVSNTVVSTAQWSTSTRAIWRRKGWFFRRAFQFSESSIYFIRFSGFEAVFNSSDADQTG